VEKNLDTTACCGNLADMRQRFDGLFRIGLLFLIAIACGTRAPGQTPTFTISPPVITNNYIGPITLTVGNLTHGKTVLIGEYLDANGNGQIDPGEKESAQFSVTDGRQPILGGATNINVPGDTDGQANGTITVALNYPGLNATLSGIAANYLFKLSDPTNAFNPVTNTFAILQQSASQGVSGTVYANNVPEAYALVVMGMQNGNGGGGTVSDVNGHFSISNAPGTYFLLASAPGYVGESSGVTIVSDAFATVDLTNVPATGYLAGTVSDSGTSNGLPGIFVTAQANNALTFGFTDTNGNFAIPAIADGWQISVDSDSGLASAAPYGYVALQNNKLATNLSSGSLSNLNFSFPRATALIYGTLTDSRSDAIPGALIEADSADGLYESDGATTVAGQYAVGVFSNSWFVGPQNLSANYLIESTNVPIQNGQAALADIQAQLVTAYLFGKVTDENGDPQTNISIVVNAVNTNSDFLTPLNQNFTTAGDGTFAIGLYGGVWNLSPECSSAGASGLVPPSVNFTVVDGVNQNNILLIEPFATATITGTIVDNQGDPVNATAFGTTLVNGTNYNPCGHGGQNTNTFQIAVFPGTWSVGVSGNFSSDGFDFPPNQNVTLEPGGTANLSFVLYPYGETPPQLSFVSHTPGGFSFSVMGDPQQKYSVQVSTNLKTWQSLVTNTAFGGSFFFQDTNIAETTRFYRAVLAP
jgi:hypothetical protein